MAIDVQAMIKDMDAAPQDRAGFVQWHLDRGLTIEEAEHAAAIAFSEIPDELDA